MDTITNLEKVLAHAAEPQQRLTATSEALTRLLQRKHPLHSGGLLDSIAAALEKHQALASSFRVATGLDDLLRRMEAVQGRLADVFRPHLRLAEAFNVQADIWNRMLAPQSAIRELNLTIPQFSHATLAWECGVAGLAQRMQDIGLVTNRAALAARLLEPPRAYTDFVQRTGDLLSQASTEHASQALRGSLVLAEQQLLDISDTLCRIVTVPSDTDVEMPVRPLEAPFRQQDELLASGQVEDEEDVELLVLRSPTAQVVSLAKQALVLVTQCNEACKTAGRQEIFKPTTRLLEVFVDLPWMLSTDRKQFSELVDCLYFVFYEGAGKDNLRFMKKNGGPLEDAECDLIWCIKHLRNKWTRHDADHGRERDITKSWDDLAVKFKWLSLAVHPTEQAHFRTMHDRLLSESISFLRLIISRLTLK